MILRLGIFVVMIMWASAKYSSPDHAAAVVADFHMLEGLGGGAFYLIGTVQMVIVLGFVAGLFATAF